MNKFTDRQALLRPYIAGKKVLHLGCIGVSWKESLREDWMHHFIMGNARETEGLDNWENECRKLQRVGYNIKVGNAENFDLKTQFDVIFAGELLEHLEDFRGFLESCKKHMREDSRLIITTPNCYGFRFVIQYLLNKPYANPYHTCHFSEKTLSQLLERHHLSVECVKYISIEREYARGVKAASLKLFEKIVPKASPTLFVVVRKREG